MTTSHHSARRGTPVRPVAAALAAALLAAPAAGALTPEQMEPHRRTVADIHAVGVALLSWLTDQVGLQGAEGAVRGGATVDVDDYPMVTAADLEALLVPRYIAGIPVVDGWGNPYDYRLDTGDLLTIPFALIRSPGADGGYEGTVYAVGDVGDLAEDLVWADGVMVRRPGPPLTDRVSKVLATQREVSGVGVAMLSWFTDQVGLAPAAAARGSQLDLDLYTPISAPALEALLVPTYLQHLRQTDPWGNPYEFWLDTGDLLGPEVMAVRARGRDGAAEGQVYPVGSYPAVELDRDTVWTDGFFARFPDDPSALIFLDGFEQGDARHWSALAP